MHMFDCHLQHTLSNPWRGDLHQEPRWAGPCSGPPSRWRTATAWMSTAPRTAPSSPRCSGTSCVAGCAGSRQRLGPEREAWPSMGCDWRWRRARPCCPPPARNIRAEFRDSERKIINYRRHRRSCLIYFQIYSGGTKSELRKLNAIWNRNIFDFRILSSGCLNTDHSKSVSQNGCFRLGHFIHLKI